MTQLSKNVVMPQAQQSSRNKFNFNKQVIATTDYGVMTPIECKLMFPGDRFDVSVDHMTRLMPMPSPTFGTITEKLRGFFVPIRILFKDWEDFISNNQKFSLSSGEAVASTPHCPNVYLNDIVYYFINSNAHVEETTPEDPTTPSSQIEYDFSILSVNVPYVESSLGTQRYFKLTPYGRHVLKLLHGLGYQFPDIMFDGNIHDLEPDFSGFPKFMQDTLMQTVSILPLLAWWRFYIDWIVPARFIRSNHAILLSILDTVYRGNQIDSITGHFNADLTPLLYMPYSFGNTDYFGSAFMTNYGYEDDKAYDTHVPGVQLLDGEYYADYGLYNSECHGSKGVFASRKGAIKDETLLLSPDFVTPQTGAISRPMDFSGDDEQGITALTIRSLGALQDMINRGKLAGSKIQDYLRVTYGIQPDNSTLDISTYLGSHSSVIKIGDVMSNADTFNENNGSGAVLGQYAGRAIGGSANNSFKYDAEEHGFFFITYELEVKSSYVQGLRPEVTALDRLDFFQPEFDGLDVDAIAMRELRAGSLFNEDTPGLNLPTVSPFDVFGYTPRYSRYKVNFDNVLGDFRRHSVNAGLQSWFFVRNFSSQLDKQRNWIGGINERFLRQFSETTSDDYDKIFMASNNETDHFYSVFYLNFSAYRHMKTLESPLEFDENGESVKVASQGAVD